MFTAMDVPLVLFSSAMGFIIGLFIGIASGYLYWGKRDE